MKFKGTHILSAGQFDLASLEQIFQVALKMEPYAKRQKVTRVLEGAILGNLFFEPSTRTRLSFAAAFNRLGGAVVDVASAKTTSMAKGESLHDTLRTVSGYVDIIMVRHPSKDALKDVATTTNIPVINGGDGSGEHPTQALLDVYTLFKHRRNKLKAINDLKIAIVGDLKYGRTVHSLSKMLGLFAGIKFIFIAPELIQMPENIVAGLKTRGHKVTLTDNFIHGIKDCDVLYMTRIQQERFASEHQAQQFKGLYCLNRELYEKHCQPNTIIMHPLPRDSRPGCEEISKDLNRHKNLYIFQQSDNGIPLRMALFALVLDVANKVDAAKKDVNWYTPF